MWRAFRLGVCIGAAMRARAGSNEEECGAEIAPVFAAPCACSCILFGSLGKNWKMMKRRRTMRKIGQRQRTLRHPKERQRGSAAGGLQLLPLLLLFQLHPPPPRLLLLLPLLLPPPLARGTRACVRVQASGGADPPRSPTVSASAPSSFRRSGPPTPAPRRLPRPSRGSKWTRRRRRMMTWMSLLLSRPGGGLALPLVFPHFLVHCLVRLVAVAARCGVCGRDAAGRARGRSAAGLGRRKR